MKKLLLATAVMLTVAAVMMFLVLQSTGERGSPDRLDEVDARVQRLVNDADRHVLGCRIAKVHTSQRQGRDTHTGVTEGAKLHGGECSSGGARFRELHTFGRG